MKLEARGRGRMSSRAFFSQFVGRLSSLLVQPFYLQFSLYQYAIFVCVVSIPDHFIDCHLALPPAVAIDSILFYLPNIQFS